jgi:hypothetical protein
MTAKKKIPSEKRVLEADMQRLMRPETLAILKEHLPVTIQQFLLRWQEADHNILSEELKIELKAFLLDVYKKDNERIIAEVTKSVREELAEVLTPILKKLESLELGQHDIMMTLSAMNERMKKTEKQVFETDEKRLVKLERYSNYTNTIFRGLVYVITAVILSVLAFFQLHHRMK